MKKIKKVLSIFVMVIIMVCAVCSSNADVYAKKYIIGARCKKMTKLKLKSNKIILGGKFEKWTSWNMYTNSKTVKVKKTFKLAKKLKVYSTHSQDKSIGKKGLKEFLKLGKKEGFTREGLSFYVKNGKIYKVGIYSVW